MKKLILTTTFVSCAAFCGFAQQIIPFKLNNHHNIIVETVVNKKDTLNLMFQIATADGSISPDYKKELKTIQFDTTKIPQGLSKNNTIKIGNVEKNGIHFFGNEKTGYDADGKLGTSIFENKIFGIDYDNQQFVIYEQLPNVTNYTAVPIKVENQRFFMPITSVINGVDYTHQFLLQSGFSGAILYDNAFSDSNTLGEKMDFFSEKKLLNSAGQSVFIKNGLLDHLKIGNTQLDKVPVGVFVGELKTQSVSYMGADLIHRFNWIIDAKNQMVYIQTNKNFNAPYYN